MLLCAAFSLHAQCPAYGDCPATDVKRRATNTNKNRKTAPSAKNIDTGVTIHKMLSSKDSETIFSEKKAATITGYIFDANPEGKESCNCHSDNAADYDIHVFIAPSATTSSIGECVVVEITPWVKTKHPEWTVAFLKANKGKKVTITGWLLYDWEHTNVSAASNPGLTNAKRGTVWELHPFTSLTFKK